MRAETLAMIEAEARDRGVAFSKETAALIAANARILALEVALRSMTSNRVHDAFCQCFEEWETEHKVFDCAKALVG